MSDRPASAPSPVASRVRVDGKFFRWDGRKFAVKGVAYGPFQPRESGDCYPPPSRVEADFRQIAALHANVVRVYTLPPRWVLDAADRAGLKLLIDIPWAKNRCFLDSPRLRDEARAAVREAVTSAAGHPAVFAFSIVNEIPPDIVRWSGVRAVGEFLEQLVEIAKAADPECLCTMASYPPTEFLQVANLDFLSFNVYLHHRRPFENYLARLQMLADSKPLVISEFGADSKREGEDEKAAMLSWQIASGFRLGLAGMIVFSFTDDWWAGGRAVTDWFMGLTTAARDEKPSYDAVRLAYFAAPWFPPPIQPKVSVVVASYNGARTLRACLESLVRLHYPDYEVILVDDGSTDETPDIAARHPSVRYIRQSNHGLSVARNTGIQAARGEIVAFTDSDCRADEDWLFHLVGDLVTSRFAGMGGHNFLPPEDSPVAAAVLVSPGGPAHVMLNDRVAEHIPGCNMAFYKWALEEIGGFDPVFTKAGDDVDVCWRLQQRGYRIGFNPAGFVWHYRRSTMGAYLRQQRGYGEAEALLIRKHPEYFNSVGGSVWRGRIYTATTPGLVLRRSIIYHGVFATGLFQTIYSAAPSWTLMGVTSLEYHAMVTLPLLIVSVPFPFLLPLAVANVLLAAAVCIGAAWQAALPRHKTRRWSRPLVALLFFLQPIVRGWARYQGHLSLQPTPRVPGDQLAAMGRDDDGAATGQLYYWGDCAVDRLDWVAGIVQRLDQQGWPSKTDEGWSEHDIEIYGSRWAQVQLTTATEEFGGGKRLFHCRLTASWSLLARVAFGSALGFELLVIGIVARSQPWLWSLLLTLPLFGWFLQQEKRNLQRLMAAFLDGVARQRNLTRLKFDPVRDRYEPA